ncbi:MAG: DUF4845 domain-containing protein [Leucothrix sp.]
MIKHNKKQQGATLISWMIGISVGILLISGGLKIGPHYMEFNSVKSFMNSIAAEPGIKTKNRREIMARIEKYLDINSMEDLSKAYYGGKSGKSGVEKPFKLVKLKKSNSRQLAVNYKVESPWLGNLAFLMDYKYQVELGKGK